MAAICLGLNVLKSAPAIDGTVQAAAITQVQCCDETNEH